MNKAGTTCVVGACADDGTPDYVDGQVRCPQHTEEVALARIEFRTARAVLDRLLNGHPYDGEG